MKFKSLKLLLSILGTLVIIALVYTLIQRSPKSKTPFATTEFNRIEIKAKDTLCIIEKIGESWRLVEPVEYPVDTGIFYPLLERLKELEIGEVCSKREAKHRDFEVDEKGVEVKVHWARHSKSFILGKMAGDFMHAYIRFPPDPETYLSKGLSKYLVDKHPDDWRDHTIFSFNPQNVKELHLGDKKLVRSDTLWMLSKAGQANQVSKVGQVNQVSKVGQGFSPANPVEAQKVNPFLDLLSNLKADGFGTVAQGFSLAKEDFEPVLEVRIILTPSVILTRPDTESPEQSEGDSEESFEEKVLYIGEKTDNNKYPAKVKGNPTIFLLNSWKVDRLKESL